MSTITFDTLRYVDQLQAAGVPDAQARAEAQALREALTTAIDNHAATKTDISRIENKLTEHDGKFNILQWMIGFNLAFTMALLWKIFK